MFLIWSFLESKVSGIQVENYSSTSKLRYPLSNVHVLKYVVNLLHVQYLLIYGRIRKYFKVLKCNVHRMRDLSL
jgi:hypothetical protein